MEWPPAGWLVSLPLLIFPCTIKSRSFFLAPAHPGWSWKKGRKIVMVVVVVLVVKSSRFALVHWKYWCRLSVGGAESRSDLRVPCAVVLDGVKERSE